MTRLSVNINKVATLRNARGGNNPDVIATAILCEKFGAQGITVHPRPDERHIRYQDVRDLKQVVNTELNVEGYPDERFMDLVLELAPDQVTLVPDAPNVLTSNTGWKVSEHKKLLKKIVQQLQGEGIRVSLFMNADELEEIKLVTEIQADRIELYTGPYAHAYHQNRNEAIADFVKAAELAEQLDLGLNAGHDLDLHNLAFFKQHLPNLEEVSIGHALICDALLYGLENTIQLYLRQLK